MIKKEYQGHESWNAWNVALWIENNEPLYRLAMDCVRRPRKDGKPVSANVAALRFSQSVPSSERTPDGARFSHRSVRLAMEGLMEDL